jgi:hypothetical protein
MTTAYDQKFVAITALGLACFALGFSVTAVAYPAHAAEGVPHATLEQHAPVPATKSTTRGCGLGESR